MNEQVAMPLDQAMVAAPRVLLVGAGGDVAGWQRFFGASGCRLLGQVSADAAADRLDQLIAVDLVWCLADEPLPLPLVARLQRMTAQGECGLVVEAGSLAIDSVFADFTAGGVVILAQPSLAERSFALRGLVGQRALAVHDRANEPDPVQLQRLTDEVQRMAETLAALTGAASGDGFTNGHGSATALEQPRRSFSAIPDNRVPRAAPPLRSADIRGIIRRRRLRDHFFSGEIFADPAWDMLLDLMAARLDGKEVSVSSLCIAAAVPATTALRWIRGMTDAGLFVRQADPYDGRRVFIALSDGAASAMSDYFAAIHAPGDSGPL